MFFFILPKYLEIHLQSNFQWEVQGNEDLKVLSHNTLVRPTIFGYRVDVFAELYNGSDKTLELTTADSVVTNHRGNRIALPLPGHNPELLEGVDTTYYDTLPSNIGRIIPPSQKRPVKVWTGLLIANDSFDNFEKKNDRKFSNIFWAWRIVASQIFGWGKIHTTLNVQIADPSAVEWYQYWNNIPYKIVKNPSGLLERCTFDFLVKSDPNLIFDEVVDQYGDKGVPDEDGSGRVVLKPDGTEIRLHTFRPTLRYVITIYDKRGRFIGFRETASFEKSPYRAVDESGFWSLGDEQPCSMKGKKYEVYLELAPH